MKISNFVKLNLFLQFYNQMGEKYEEVVPFLTFKFFAISKILNHKNAKAEKTEGFSGSNKSPYTYKIKTT